MYNRTKYVCKNCGWETSITAQWADLKPPFCGNKKCDYSKSRARKTKKSFRTNSEMLEIIRPQPKKADSKKPRPSKKPVKVKSPKVEVKEESKDLKQDHGSKSREKTDKRSDQRAD